MNRYYYVITTSCNYSCKFCYMRYGKVKASSLEVLKNNLGNIEHLVLIGGEPTLNFNEVLKVLEISKNIEEITLVTNGTLLTQEKLDLLAKYKNLYIQVSIYDLKTAFKIAKLSFKKFIIHFLISDMNFNLLPVVQKFFIDKQFWVSLDREIKIDITPQLLNFINEGILKKEMFRDYGNIGKKCLVFNKSNFVINGSKIVMDCLHRQSKGTKMKIKEECLKCKNIFCDACICEDISNHSVICKIFKNLERYYECRS